jgi:hypothetical protein
VEIQGGIYQRTTIPGGSPEGAICFARETPQAADAAISPKGAQISVHHNIFQWLCLSQKSLNSDVQKMNFAGKTKIYQRRRETT